MIVRIFISLATLSLFATSCDMTFEIGIEKLPTAATFETAAAPTQTEMSYPIATEVQSTSTTTPHPLPPSPIYSTTPARENPTDTPSPTPLPGLEVIPLTSMGSNIPWLPLDRTRWPSVHVVTFNTKLPPYNNSLVRKAFAAAIDKDVIAEMARRYYAIDPEPATTFIPPQTLGRDLFGEVGIKFDPIYARDLLTQAGYKDTSKFPKVTFIVNSYGDTAPGARFNMARAMADMWNNYLGVTVDVQAYQPASFRDRIRSNPPELFWVGWVPDSNDPDTIRQTYRSGSEFNYGSFSDDGFDSLVDRAATIHDPAARQALYVEAERVLCETAVGIIPIYHSFTNNP